MPEMLTIHSALKEAVLPGLVATAFSHTLWDQLNISKTSLRLCLWA